MNTTHVHEIDWLRGVACLSIVFLHSIVWGMSYIGALSSLPLPIQAFLDALRLFLYYGTPTFIFITAFIFGFRYRKNDELPRDFIRKRSKYILFPYVCMAVFYAIPYGLLSATAFGQKVMANIFIGDFHAYFVLIIFQFYLLFFLLKNILENYSPFFILAISFVINIAYLAIFNFTSPIHFPFSAYLWERFYWIPFFGWIFYFTVAYYAGRYYPFLASFIARHRSFILLAPVATSIALLSLHYSGTLTIDSSKRVDMLLHTIAVIAFVFSLSQKYGKTPGFLILISKYSYGIYLLHTFYIAVFIFILNFLPYSFSIFSILVLFAGSIVLSISTIYLVNLLPFGKYFVGKVNVQKGNRDKLILEKRTPTYTPLSK